MELELKFILGMSGITEALNTQQLETHNRFSFQQQYKKQQALMPLDAGYVGNKDPGSHCTNSCWMDPSIAPLLPKPTFLTQTEGGEDN